MLKELQKLDYDRYISIIFAPKEYREDLVSVAQFNLEIAKVKNKVTEPMIGLIRFQWWREALEEIFDESKTPRRHNIVQRLKKLATDYRLQSTDFLSVINAREKDLDASPFENLGEFKSYLIDTSFPLNKIFLDIVGIESDAIKQVVKDISYAWGITAILRSAHKNFGAGRCIYPKDMCEKYGLEMANLGKPDFLAASEKIVEQLCIIANQKLADAEEKLNKIDRKTKKSAKPVLLLSDIARHNLKQIARNKNNILTKQINHYLGFISLMRIYFT